MTIWLCVIIQTVGEEWFMEFRDLFVIMQITGGFMHKLINWLQI